MPHQGIRTLLLLLIALIGCCIGGLSICLWAVDYHLFSSFVLELVHKQDWKEYFQESVFPLSRFIISRYLSLLLTILWLFFSFWFIPKATIFSQKVHHFLLLTKSKFQQQRQQTNPLEKKLLAALFLFFILRMLWQIHHYELQYDEAWTYNHFISNGFFISAISPNNNHILYTLFACLTDILPIEGKYSLRLPVLLGGMATCLLFYAMLRNFWGWKSAFIALSWFAFSPSVSFYSMYARGYIFQLFFSILATWSSLQILEKKRPQNYYWIIWSIANILGFYSVPTYAYIFVTINLFLFLSIIIHSSKQGKMWFISNLWLLAITSLLYLPILVSNGINALIDIASKDAPSGENFIHYQDKVADWLLLGNGRLTPVYWLFVILIILIVGLLIFYKKTNFKKQPVYILLLFLALPSVLNLTIGTQPPFRVWCFLSIYIGMAFAFLGHLFIKKSPSSIFIIIAISLISFNLWRTEVHYAITWSEHLDKEAKKIADLLLDNNIQECYFTSNYDKPLLEYYYLRKGKRLNVKMIASDSKSYAPFVGQKNYEAVLWDKEDRESSLQEKEWLEEKYPHILYQNSRIDIRTPKGN